MFNRSKRRLLAPLVILAVVFAQLALTAHACPVHASTAPLAPASHALGSASHDAHPCSESARVPGAPGPVACVAHCTDGAALPPALDLPAVSLVALPVAAAPFEALATADRVARSPLVALPGAPPVALAFCRLLI